MNKYTLEEAREKLAEFGIKVEVYCRASGVPYWYDFYSNNGARMEKPDGYDSTRLRPSDFNMIIDGYKER